MLDRILIPLDGSAAAEEAIAALRPFVAGTGAVVHLLVVRPPIREVVRSERGVVYLDELLRDEAAAWRDYLVRKGSELAYNGVVVRHEVRFGEPVAETLAAAVRHGVQLIAVAAPAQPWWQRLARPSLAQRLLAQAAIPVLTVPVGRPLSGQAVLRYRSLPA
ncbi:MAG TPA: universal stress protein [Chloroflexota bacterium]|jgi:nucleotide-binding universal stress UspA family protein|nr:universal stress protein [Chloroflexota bacterium]